MKKRDKPNLKNIYSYNQLKACMYSLILLIIQRQISLQIFHKNKQQQQQPKQQFTPPQQLVVQQLQRAIPYQVNQFFQPQDFQNPLQLFDYNTLKSYLQFIHFEHIFPLVVKNKLNAQMFSKLDSKELQKFFKLQKDQQDLLLNHLKLLQYFVGMQWSLQTPLKQDIVVALAIHPNNRYLLVQLLNKSNPNYSIPPVKIQLHIMNPNDHVLLEHIFYYGHDCVFLQSPIDIVRVEVRSYIPAMVVNLQTNELLGCDYDTDVQLAPTLKLDNSLSNMRNMQNTTQMLTQDDLQQQKQYQYQNTFSQMKL